MMSVLIIKGITEKNLSDFADNIKKTLNVPDFDRRQSDNYEGGEYFCCESLGINVKVAVEIYDKFSDYGFIISFEPRAAMIGDGFSLDGLADVVARRLAVNGYKVIIQERYGQAGTPYTIYRKNNDQAASYKEEVITEDFDS